VEAEAKKNGSDFRMNWMELRSELREAKDSLKDLYIGQTRLEEG
jgi:hypothetical protein